MVFIFKNPNGKRPLLGIEHLKRLQKAYNNFFNSSISSKACRNADGMSAVVFIGGHAHGLGGCGVFLENLSLNKCQNFKKSPYNSAFFIKNLPI
jgi:hypothetical protein